MSYLLTLKVYQHFEVVVGWHGNTAAFCKVSTRQDRKPNLVTWVLRDQEVIHDKHNQDVMKRVNPSVVSGAASHWETTVT